MKNILTFLIIVVLPLAGLLVSKNTLAKIAVETGVQHVTGLPLKIQALDLNLGKTYIGVSGLRVLNPAGFDESAMVDMPEIYVDYDLGAILQGKIHLPEVRLNLREFVVVKNASGALNLRAIKTLQKKGTPAPKPAETTKKPMQLDKLSLKIGKVVYKDYSRGGDPVTREFRINVDEQYSNVMDLNHIIRLIVLKSLSNTPIASLTNFDITGLQTSVNEAFQLSSRIASGTVDKAARVLDESAAETRKALEQTQQGLEALTGSAEKAAEKVGEAVKEISGGLKNATDTLKQKLKLSLGGQQSPDH